MPSLGIGHRAGCTIGKSRTHGSRWRWRQMCCQRVCGCTPGDWDSNNPVLAVSLRRCRTTAYTSSAVPRFTNMLLSPRPFGSRSVVRLGVMDPELRPPLVAIPSVRDTAHAFTAHGATPLVDLHSTSYEASVSISMASTEVHPCFIPFRQHARAPRSRTACAFAGYLVRHLPLYFILPEARGLRHGEYAPCGRRYRPPTTMPHPTLRAGFGVSLGSPLPTSHSP